MDYHSLLTHPDFQSARRVVLFCNQTAYDHQQQTYLFDQLADQNRLCRLLVPEHGLFSEFQDQESIQNKSYRGIPCTSLYNKMAGITGPQADMLEGADALVIDFQDAGVRFFTYTSHAFALLEFVALHFPNIPVFITDKPNPAGQKIEGTLLHDAYRSFLGAPGMIHRHGLSSGELCLWWLRHRQISIGVHLVQTIRPSTNHGYISPSPNLPVLESLQVYPGQCFWEATTFSEGRGTTRPFTLFGHPNLHRNLAEDIAKKFNKEFQSQAYLRTTCFIPVFHKHSHHVCQGWQMHLLQPDAFHSVYSSLWLMRLVRQEWEEAFWREGPYEFDSDCTAAQLLIGDDECIDFVNGNSSDTIVMQKMERAETTWRRMRSELHN